MNSINPIKEIFERYMNHFQNFKFRDAITEVNKLAQLGNEFIEKYKLWIRKESQEETDIYIGTVCAICWLVGELLSPIMPRKSAKITSIYCPNNLLNATYSDIKQHIDNLIGTIKLDFSDISILFNIVKF